MKYLTMAILMIAALQTPSARGDIIFSVVSSKAQITLGDTTNFTVFVQSRGDAAVTVGGYSLNVSAGNGDGRAGTFTSGTFSFLVGDPGQAWDLTTTPGQAFSTADTGNTGGTGVGRSLSTLTTLGELTLDTRGATAGDYQISVDQLSAIQINGNFIAGGVNGASFAGPVGFSITAVPEPSSMLLLSGMGIAAGGWYRVRRKK